MKASVSALKKRKGENVRPKVHNRLELIQEGEQEALDGNEVDELEKLNVELTGLAGGSMIEDILS